ncbi:HTH-type transcriptional regulator Ptr1 [uncultured archaeon]|nr:HTH-type transcriptional regulator Ptr1 [uncultured archaeon]
MTRLNETVPVEQTRINLDLKDRRILAMLDWDARLSIAKLAKEVRLSKNAVAYRISRLEKAGIILGYYPVIDFGRLGYYSHRVQLSLHNADARVKQEIEKYISNPDSEISWSVWVRGVADLLIVIWTRSLKEFKSIFNKFNTRFGKYIEKRLFTTTYGFEQYPYRFLLGKNDWQSMIIDEGPSFHLDKLDSRILASLNSNARKSCTEIAKETGSNYKTVQYRIKKLAKNHVLIGTRAFINHTAFGYNYYKFMLYFTHYSDEEYHKLKNYLRGLQETVYIVFHVNSDLDAEMLFKSDNEFFEFIDGLQEKFPGLIKNFEYFLFTRTIQIEYVHQLDA